MVLFTFPALPQVDKISIMEKSWDAMNPLKNEEELIGQWFACVFKSTKTPNLYIGKIRKRFLTAEVNEQGYVAAVEMDCLQLKLGVTYCIKHH